MQELCEALLRQHQVADASHDIAHARRVVTAALAFADELAEPTDRQVIVCAAMLHDLVSPPKNSPDRQRASLLSADKAVELLREAAAVTAEQLDNIHHAIHAHSFSANVDTQTWEARIVQDADRLESLGAIGVARTFYTGGTMGSDLWHSDDPRAEQRALDDRRYSLDHFAAKLLTLPATMKTEPGRLEAHRRADFLRQFRDQLLRELGW